MHGAARTHCGTCSATFLAPARYVRRMTAAAIDRCPAAGAHHGRRGQPGPAGAAAARVGPRRRRRLGHRVRRRHPPRLAGPRPSGAPTGERHRRRPGDARRRHRRGGHPPRAGVVGDGVRRLRQQPDPAHRGRHPAPRRRLRVRPPAGHRRGDGRSLATHAPRPHGHGAAPGRGDGRRRHSLAGRRAGRRVRPAHRRGRPAGAVPPPRRPGVGGGAGRRPPSRRRVQRGARRLGGGGAGAGAERRPAAHPAPRSAGHDRGRRPLALPAGADPARPAQLHPRAVAGRQRPAQGPGLAPDGDQRAGVRRGHRSPLVDDDHAEATPGADARGDGRGRRSWRPSPPSARSECGCRRRRS